MLVAYSMAPIMNDVAAEAETILGQNRLAVQPPRVLLMRIIQSGDYKSTPYPHKSRNALFVISPPGEERTERTNADGIVVFDTKYAGAEVKISEKMVYDGFYDKPIRWVKTYEIKPTRLELGKTNVTQATFQSRSN
jgi:hypothetical protein